MPVSLPGDQEYVSRPELAPSKTESPSHTVSELSGVICADTLVGTIVTDATVMMLHAETETEYVPADVTVCVKLLPLNGGNHAKKLPLLEYNESVTESPGQMIAAGVAII
jgi:hypothetical protein